ncbi:MAG: acetate--CoA ligase family protein [Actinomycetota bacterium]
MARRLPLDVSGRPLRLRDVDLDTFLHPRRIAVVGASEQSARPNTAMTRKLAAWADRNGAEFHPVNPGYTEVLGRPCVGTLAEVPGAIDLVIILTGRPDATFAEARARGARFAVIFAAGFSETGAEGAQREARLVDLVAGGATRLLGPNTNLNAFEDFRTDLEGPAIALITQSGHQGRPVFQGQEVGIRLSHWAPTGNEVDLEFADFARYFTDQPEVGALACYIEGFRDGRTLMLAADHAAARRVPIVMVKVGRSEAGRSMAQSHTGHLTGSDTVVAAAFDQFGVTRVDGLDELLEVSMALARTRPASIPVWARRGRTPGVGVYAISGGTGAHMADLLAAAGLALPELTGTTQRTLHDGLIPDYLRVSNPVDCGGPPVADHRGRRILDAVLADPRIDVLVIPITGAVAAFSEPLTRDIVDAARTTTKPVFVVWGAPAGTDDTYYRRLLDGGLPVFRTFGNCVRAVRAYTDYWSFAARHRSPFRAAPRQPTPAAAKARRIIEAGAEPGGALSEWDAKRVLRAYGIRTTRDRLCRTAAESVAAARTLGYPVVMKVASPDLAHKSEAGAVRVGVSTAAEVRAAHADLVRAAEAAGASVQGILVCEMVTDGVETLVGSTTDELFGPVVTFGLGGVFVEVFGDVVTRVPPFAEVEVCRALGALRGLPLLHGTRGRRAVDVDAFVATVMKVQTLVTELADVVAELDVNPVVVKPRGTVALDALVVRK